ncbi:SLATT domain-containing protein [Archangium primigenium]|uniref:SLATT domain-containing protein n=1 Tax=[Archangium] primigenium TaxID=2792470 RepID=UPI00195CC28B|nr:SLATT domain-containing protein [Archangium primigenium]MBM7118626.1 SLATT domain-containing protein [Archangium primigenium]
MATSSAPKPSENLQPLKLSSVRQPHQDEDLQVLYDEVMAKLEETIGWYDRRKSHNKRWASRLRGTAIVLAGVASVVPIAVSMLAPVLQPQRWVPVASILAAFSAGCVGLDRLFGFSVSWMRYVTALLELQAQRELLQFNWSRRALEARLGGGTQSERLAAGIQLLYATRLAINQVLKDETQEWVARFSGALQDLEKSAVAQRGALGELGQGLNATQGALRVQIAGFDTLETPECEVQFGDGPSETHTGPTKAFAHLSPGQYVLRVKARRGGRPVSVEEIVTVLPGETSTVTLTLT